MATGKRLGKGIGALFSEFEEEYDSSINKAKQAASDASVIKTEGLFSQVEGLDKQPRRINEEGQRPSEYKPEISEKTETPIAKKNEKPLAEEEPGKVRLFDVEEKKQRFSAPPTGYQSEESGEVSSLAVENIFANPNQPRKSFNEEKIKELAASVRLHGVISPIIVSKTENGKCMIIAGERRYRAAILAGLKEVPVIIRDYTPLQIKEISLIENLQREDLNPIEAANAIKQLMTEYHFTQEIIAERIAKSRSAVANSLRLLTLSPEVIKLVETERLSAGHARALVVVEDKDYQLKLAVQASDNKMSVRDLEKAVKKHNNPNTSKPKNEQSLELRELVNEMQRVLSTKVSAIGNDRRGRIYIDYYTPDDLDRIDELMKLWKSRGGDNMI